MNWSDDNLIDGKKKSQPLFIRRFEFVLFSVLDNHKSLNLHAAVCIHPASHCNK